MLEAEKLTAFLLALQTSPTLRKKFDRNARREMEQFDLAPSTIRAILDKDAERLWDILSVLPVRTYVGKVVGVDTKPKPPKKK